MSIFVSVASYRDPVCSTTIKSLFEKAQNPERVFVGICQQNSDKDSDCISNFRRFPWFTNIRIMRLRHTEAKGPTFARYHCSKLWNGEDYFLQIDSHTKFLRHWDSKLIDMIQAIKITRMSQKPVISHYPKSIDEYNSKSTYDYNVPRICKGFFNERGMISFLGAETFNTKGRITPGAYIAAGMFFAESSFLKEIPFDPKLPYLFVGEEILHTIRFYTHGWDIFHPSENVVYHEYTRAEKPKIWTDKRYSDERAFNKVKFLIGLEYTKNRLTQDPNIQKYGLGTIRTLHDYYQYASINLDKKQVTKNFCHPFRKHDPDTESK